MFYVCEGRSFHTMVRAAELVLAVAENLEVMVQFEKKDGYSPWRHLLSPHQQLRLHQLSHASPVLSALATPLSTPAYLTAWRDIPFDNLQEAQAGLDRANSELASVFPQAYQQKIWVRTGRSVPAYPPEHSWLILVDEAEHVTDAQLSNYERSYCIQGLSPAAHPSLTPLPCTLHPAFLTASDRPPHAKSVLLIGDGHLAANAAWAQQLIHAGALQIGLFDPHFSPEEWRAFNRSSSVCFIPMCGPDKRAQAFQKYSTVMLADARLHVDNHFFWEAVALNIAPLADLVDLSPQQPPPHWTPSCLNHALTRAADRDPSYISKQKTALLPSSQLDAYFKKPLKPRPLASHVFSMPPHRVAHFSSMEQADACPDIPDASVHRLAILCPGPQAQWQPAMDPFLHRYATVCLQTGHNAQLYVPLVTHLFDLKLDSALSLSDLLYKYVNPSASQHPATLPQSIPQPSPPSFPPPSQEAFWIDVIHLQDSPEHISAARRQLAGMAAQWEPFKAPGPPPTLLIYGRKVQPISHASQRRIGIGVATDGIQRGLALDAPGRYQLLWLNNHHAAHKPHARIYFYPWSSCHGLDQDECDAGLMPTLLKDNKIDLFCHTDPLLFKSMYARHIWAQKAIPVVGMMHSIHAAELSTEMIMMLLNTPTYSFDALISPSRCGAVAFQGLLDAASEWVAQSTGQKKSFQGTLEVIPYGIDTTSYQGLHRASCRNALGLPQDALIILSVGRFSKQEKADLLPLLIALKTLRRTYPSVMLVLCGGTSQSHEHTYRSDLTPMVASLQLGDSVLFYEDMAMEDKVLCYGASDIFVSVSDSIQETFGLSLLEAMAAGLPVVASEWNGYREIVRHGITGFLVPTYGIAADPQARHIHRMAEGLHGYGHRDLHEGTVVELEALKHYLEKLIIHPSLRERMGACGKDICRKHYEQATQARHIGDFLLKQIRAATTCSWSHKCSESSGSPALHSVSFTDPVEQRFSHYPCSFLQDDTLIQVSEMARNPSERTAILKLLNFDGPHETKLIEELILKASVHAKISLLDLSNKLEDPPYSLMQIKARLARCVKYGFLTLCKEPLDT